MLNNGIILGTSNPVEVIVEEDPTVITIEVEYVEEEEGRPMFQG